MTCLQRSSAGFYMACLDHLEGRELSNLKLTEYQVVQEG